MMVLTRLIQLVLVLIPIVILGWLVDQQFAPGGTFAIRHSVGEPSPFIDRLLPDARVLAPIKQDGDWVQSLIGDPVFFFVHPQRAFERATFEIWFQNEDVPIVEFGGLARKQPEVYDLQPMQNLLIDQSTWFRLDENGTVLLQRNKQFDSIDAFLKNLPSPEDIAVYQTDILPPFRLPAYRASTLERTVNISLRGRHAFKTYIKDELLSMRFEYMDMNRDEGADPVVVTVFDEQGRPVGSSRLDDDGDVSKLGRSSSLRSINLSLSGLEEGVYKVDFDVSRDIFIRNLKTTQSKLVAMNGIYLADEVGYREPANAVTLYTSAKRMQMQTRHSDGVQTLQIAGKAFQIEEPYRLYTYTSESPGLIDVDVVKGDIELFVDQPIAFSADMFFNPEPNRLQFYTNLDTQGIDYVIATYQSPEKRGDWYVAKMDVDLSRLHFETDEPDLRFFRNGNWKFVLSLPGSDKRESLFRVKNIDIRFEGKEVTIGEILGALQN